MGKILAIYFSSKKGTARKKIKEGMLRRNYGLLKDAHAGPGKRQVSLFLRENLEEMREKGLKVGCSGFGENFTISGIKITSLAIRTKLKVGKAVLEITQIGKTCKKPCKFYPVPLCPDKVDRKKKRCFLSSRGIFARVLKGGLVRKGEPTEIIRS
ncbi:MAG: MOSC domain-containing protein [Nitrospirae bacterium]|nr:MOSC domain-containing protein [Nitrospirota bacterium]